MQKKSWILNTLPNGVRLARETPFIYMHFRKMLTDFRGQS